MHKSIWRIHLQQLTRRSIDVSERSVRYSNLKVKKPTSDHTTLFETWQEGSCVASVWRDVSLTVLTFSGKIQLLTNYKYLRVFSCRRQGKVVLSGSEAVTTNSSSFKKKKKKKASCAALFVYLETAFSQCQGPHTELNEVIYSPTESGLELCFH